ncbi:MAG: hypothetical protein HY904_16005 [Deltaproteobacteria bacterium]|nr:hypothetical protein [Deltaproteobacteria bacterium]
MNALVLMAVLAGVPAGAVTADKPGAADKAPRDDMQRDVFSSSEPPAAPLKPQPWIKTPFIFAFQGVGGLGLRLTVLPLWFVPVLGPPLAVVLGPLLEAAGVALVGDRLGDARAPLWGPLLASVALGGTSGVLTLAALASAGAAAATGVARMVPGSPLAAVDGRLLALGVGSWLVVSVAVLLLVQVPGLVSPAGSVAAYHALKGRKRTDDDGTGLVRLFTAPEPDPPPVPAPADPRKP